MKKKKKPGTPACIRCGSQAHQVPALSADAATHCPPGFKYTGYFMLRDAADRSPTLCLPCSATLILKAAIVLQHDMLAAQQHAAQAPNASHP